MRWPANRSSPSALGNGGSVPPLFLVYWSLHGIHIVLAVFAARRSWQPVGYSESQPLTLKTRCPGPKFNNLWCATVPWLLLALIFGIPGVYLEWPADPWEHLRRITEWNSLPRVGFHSSGYKSFYFFAYSWVGWLAPEHLLQWLNVYYVGISLLLTWQYYILAKTLGLDRRWAFTFGLINTLTFGNSCFSFYRYYGISTSIFAQLGAIALIRIALQASKDLQLAPRPLIGPTSSLNISSEPTNIRRRPNNARALLFSTVSLSALIGFNHLQGLGIAAVGVSSIAAWHIIRWKRSSAIYWLAATAIVLSTFTIVWWPREPAIDAVFRPQGWLNSWYGFNFSALTSPAASRALLIFGSFGLFNLAVGLLLLLRNRAAGWLTLGPLIALSLPCVAIPLSSRIATVNAGEIVAFHRMFFAVPSGLAIIALLQAIRSRTTFRATGVFRSLCGIPRRADFSFVLFILSLVLVVCAPTDSPYFNRVWSLLSRTPSDLKLLPIWRTTELFSTFGNTASERHIIATSLPGYVVDLQHVGDTFVAYRDYTRSARLPVNDMTALDEFIAGKTNRIATHALLVDPFVFVSPTSLAAVFSMHWPAQEVSLAAVGTRELTKLGIEAGLPRQPIPGGTLLLIARKNAAQSVAPDR